MDLLKEMETITEDKKKFMLPFPMGVFGTLRMGHGNSRLMKGYSNHINGFLSHFIADGLRIKYCSGSSAPFEIFTYEPEEWSDMIPSVDRLEGFSPGQQHSGYHRTLAYIHVLPKDFCHPLFESPHLGNSRNLEISCDKWKFYKKMPCWIYSSINQNKTVVNKEVDSPIIWY